MKVHIGVDLGGTKILAEALSEQGECLGSYRLATPRYDYNATLSVIAQLVFQLEDDLQISAPVGIGMPGSILPSSGLVQNANSTWLNGMPFGTDISKVLNRDVKLANDANCFALSEASDGAACGARSMFGVIMGTGVGGGLVMNEQLINGPRSIGGEWGHCSLPYSTANESELADTCWCGQRGCIESWISGPALVAHYNKQGLKQVKSVEALIELSLLDDKAALRAFELHLNRTARALAMVVNIFDPEVIVLGGGLSSIDHFYEQLPSVMQPFVFSDESKLVDIRKPKYGATSGVRGAARLWPF